MRHTRLTLSKQFIVTYFHWVSVCTERITAEPKYKAVKIPLITVKTLTIRFVCTFLPVSKNG